MLRGQPRYSVVAQSLIQDIAAGKHPVGSRMPSEADICQNFGVSRQTAREAVRMLTDMGLVSPHAGIGTIVKAKSASSRYIHTIESISDLFQYIQETELRVVAEREVLVDAALGELIGGHFGQRWIEYEAVRSLRRDRTPIVFSRLYIPQGFSAVRRELDGLRTPAYALLEKAFGVQVVEMVQQTSAQPIPAAIARRLGVKSGSAGLHVVRRYLDGEDKTLLATDSLYPAGGFSFSIRLRMAWNGSKA